MIFVAEFNEIKKKKCVIVAAHSLNEGGLLNAGLVQ